MGQLHKRWITIHVYDSASRLYMFNNINWPVNLIAQQIQDAKPMLAQRLQSLVNI